MKYDYAKIGKFAESLKAAGIEGSVIDSIMKDGDKIKQTDKNEKKAEWFYKAMKTMDKLIKPAERHEIRQDCACCLGGKRHDICVKINKKFNDEDERLKAADEAKLVFGNGVRKISEGRYEVSFFPESLEVKSCPCIRGLNKPMPITYCYCCGGHVKYHLETVLGRKLSVKVIETALSTAGKKGCKFELKDCNKRQDNEHI